jgi:hypothetical protein
MKSFHGPPLGEAKRNQNIRIRYIDKTERVGMIDATIIADLCPT